MVSLSNHEVRSPMRRRSGRLDLLFQALADPARRKMLERLGRGPASLGQLAVPLGMSLPAATQHLRLLEACGLVTSRKLGRQRICELDAAVLKAARLWIDGQIAWHRRLDALADRLMEKSPGPLWIQSAAVRREVEATLLHKDRIMNFVTSKDGTRIAYTATGKGPAITLVNGATAFPALDPTLPALTEMLQGDFTFVTFDRRGRGQSGDTRPFSPEREIEDIEALINQFGGSTTLYGQSSGAVLSLIAAGRLPGVTHVLAYEPPYSTPGTDNDLPSDYVEKLARYNAENNGDAAAALFLTGAIRMPEEAVEGMRQSDFWPVMVGVGPTIYYDAVYMTLDRQGYEIPSHLWSVSKAKFLIVDGGASFPGMKEAADAVAAATPGAGRKSLGDQGHGPSAEAIVPILKAFAAA